MSTMPSKVPFAGTDNNKFNLIIGLVLLALIVTVMVASPAIHNMILASEAQATLNKQADSEARAAALGRAEFDRSVKPGGKITFQQISLEEYRRILATNIGQGLDARVSAILLDKSQYDDFRIYGGKADYSNGISDIEYVLVVRRKENSSWEILRLLE
ncbi:MAG: hypothetical protein Q8912_11675 [Bacillota bacterium]|nr:hypothetical protein [Bacillota bacterium]